MQTDLGREIESIALVDTHEHLLPEDQWAGDNAKLIGQMKEEGEPGWGDVGPDILQDLFLNYAPSDLEVAGATKEALQRLFDRRLATSSAASRGSVMPGRRRNTRATVRRFG
jgi:hypothetical protein